MSATPDRDQVFHDMILLALKATGAEHEPCRFCTPDMEDAMAEITEEEVAAKIADATAPLMAQVSAFQAQVAERDTKIADLEAKVGERDVNDATATAIADAVAPLNAKIADLETQLDTAKLAQGEAENANKAITDWLQGEADVQAKADRRADRIAAAKETGAWPEDTFDDTVAANTDRFDRWAEMEDAAWDAVLEGWKQPHGDKTDPANGPLPKDRSSMKDAATDKVEQGGGKSGVLGVIESSIPSMATAQAN